MKTIEILLLVAFSVGLKHNLLSQDCHACQDGLYKMSVGFLEKFHLKTNQFGQKHLLGGVAFSNLGGICLEMGLRSAAEGQTLLSVSKLGSKVMSKVGGPGLNFPFQI